MFYVIKNDILYFMNRYLEQGTIFACLGLLILIIGIWVYRKIHGMSKLPFGGKTIYKGFLMYVFLFYIYMVLGITFFSREPTEVTTIDLKLFHTFANSYVAKLYIYENIAMFVPLGFFTYLLFEKFRKVYLAALLGIVCSILIEMVQYITRLGKLQVDDIFNNVVGMLLGYVMGWVIYQAVYMVQNKIEDFTGCSKK